MEKRVLGLLWPEALLLTCCVIVFKSLNLSVLSFLISIRGAIEPSLTRVCAVLGFADKVPGPTRSVGGFTSLWLLRWEPDGQSMADMSQHSNQEGREVANLPARVRRAAHIRGSLTTCPATFQGAFPASSLHSNLGGGLQYFPILQAGPSNLPPKSQMPHKTGKCLSWDLNPGRPRASTIKHHI